MKTSGAIAGAYQRGGFKCAVAFLASASVLWGAVAPVHAETMSGALARAYNGNPNLNQQRAGLRATDESVPQAKAGWLPKAGATGSIGYQYQYYRSAPIPGQPTTSSKFYSTPRGYGVNVTQTIFDGFATLNAVRGAEATVFGGREGLRDAEQTILFASASSYMDVLRDTAILDLRKNNTAVLEEQVRQTRVRFQVGEVTATDVAQTEASLANSKSEIFAAQAVLQASIANYRQNIGIEPKSLAPAKGVDPLLPKKLDTAIGTALTRHPQILSSLHTVDAAGFAVKTAEAALYPTLSVTGATSGQMDSFGYTGQKTLNGSITGQLNIPIYQGGAEYASIRKAKEQYSQAQLESDYVRDQVRAQLVTAWGRLDTAKAQIISNQAAVAAAEVALNGVREEARVGQRTTFDILTQQQALLTARVNLVIAQHDRVVASYAVLSAMGELTAQRLDLNVDYYNPTVHFDDVKNKFFGVTTPDGH